MAKAKEAQVNESAFLKQLNKNKQAAKVAAKSERPSGILDDAAILDRLGMTAEEERISIPAKVSKIQPGFAKGDTNRPFFRFAYVLTDNSPISGKGKGMMLSNYHELTEGTKDGEVFRTVEEAFEKLFYELQGIGENTKSLEKDDEIMSKTLDLAKKHTANKTEVMLSISTYKRGNGNLGINITPNPLSVDNSDLDDKSDDSEESDFDATEWIGGWVTWTDDDGSVDFCIESYDEDSHTFTGKDENGDEYSEAPVDQCEWCDNQRDD
jgi:hypothetical protein